MGARERLLGKIKMGEEEEATLQREGFKKETAQSDKTHRRDKRRADVAKKQMKGRTRGDEMR